MSISRLHDFVPSTVIQSTQVDNELNQLVTESNIKLGNNGGTITGNLVINGDAIGLRTTMLLAGNQFDSQTDSYVTLGNYTGNLSLESGMIMSRSGSLVGFSVFINCTTYVGTYSFTPIIRKNGSTFVSGSEIAISATGVQTQGSTYVRGVNPFVNGDRLALIVDANLTGTTSDWFWAMIEVQLDT